MMFAWKFAYHKARDLTPENEPISWVDAFIAASEDMINLGLILVFQQFVNTHGNSQEKNLWNSIKKKGWLGQKGPTSPDDGKPGGDVKEVPSSREKTASKEEPELKTEAVPIKEPEPIKEHVLKKEPSTPELGKKSKTEPEKEIDDIDKTTESKPKTEDIQIPEGKKQPYESKAISEEGKQVEEHLRSNPEEMNDRHIFTSEQRFAESLLTNKLQPGKDAFGPSDAVFASSEGGPQWAHDAPGKRIIKIPKKAINGSFIKRLDGTFSYPNGKKVDLTEYRDSLIEYPNPNGVGVIVRYVTPEGKISSDPSIPVKFLQRWNPYQKVWIPWESG